MKDARFGAAIRYQSTPYPLSRSRRTVYGSGHCCRVNRYRRYRRERRTAPRPQPSQRAHSLRRAERISASHVLSHSRRRAAGRRMRAARAAWCIAVQRPVSLLSCRSHRAEPSAALRAAHIQARAIRSYYDIQSRDMDIQQRGIRNRHRRIADAMPRARPGLSQVPRHRSERGNRRRVRSAERFLHPRTAR